MLSDKRMRMLGVLIVFVFMFVAFSFLGTVSSFIQEMQDDDLRVPFDDVASVDSGLVLSDDGNGSDVLESYGSHNIDSVYNAFGDGSDEEVVVSSVVIMAIENISGQVTRFSGSPISGLNVSVYNQSNGAMVASALTSSSGNYFVNLPAPGYFFVIFNNSYFIYGGDDYRNVSLTVGAAESKVLNVSLYSKGYGSYNLTVADTWNGRPIPNANVTIYPSYPNPPQFGFTDDNGNVLIEIIANSTQYAIFHDIVVSVVGYKNSYVYSESILEGMNKDLSVSLGGACEIYGTVTDSEDNLVEPLVEGAYVELWNYENTYRVGWGSSYYYSDFVDASGHYSINFPSTLPGITNCNAYLHVNASGYISKDDVLVESTTIRDVELKGAAYVAGDVFDASNTSNPVGDALVSIMNNGTAVYQILTDSAGSFNISVKDAFNHTVEIQAVGYGVYANTNVYNSSVGYGNILLYGLGTLNGTLVDATNNSILLVGVEVTISGNGAVYRTLTDSSGRFGIVVKDGINYDVRFDMDGYLSSSVSVPVLAETDIGSMILYGKNDVHGVVTDSINQRSPYLNGVKVEIISQVDNRKYTTYTDSDGSYSLYVPSTMVDYVVRFDKSGYNISQSTYNAVNNVEIDADLRGATHIEGTVTDVYSHVESIISSVIIEVIDENGYVYYRTYSDSQGHYSIDLGVDFNYILNATKIGYQDEQVMNLPWDQDRSGTGGTDRIENIALNGTVDVYVKTIDAFDGMEIDNSLICVLYNSSSDCSYTKTTGSGGDTSFNIRGAEDYQLKITRDGYIQKIIPSGAMLYYNSDVSLVVEFGAYAQIYLSDMYALNNEEIRDAYLELYLYNNQTAYAYSINETIVNITADCNGMQQDDINVTLIGITYPYYSSQNTTGGSSVVAFRIVPSGNHTLIIDGTAVGCGYYTGTINVTSSGTTSNLSYDTDTIPPVIYNLTESDDPLNFGDTVVVAVSALDSQNLVDTFLIEINGTNRTMIYLFNNTYVYSWTPVAVGLETYVIYVNDTWGNINQAMGNITVMVMGDTEAPLSTYVGQNATLVLPGDSVLFYAYWTDNTWLDTAVLETNESGVWANKTTYGSPMSLSGNSFWTNFTWVNSSVLEDNVFGWRIWVNDSSGNWNVTDIYTFVVPETTLSVHVRDENMLPVLQDSNGIGINVTISNSTHSVMKNTLGNTGDVTFDDVVWGHTYNVSVNGTMGGYGTGWAYDIVILGNNDTTVIVNMTKLTVSVVDDSQNPVTGITATVYEPDDTTVFKNAGGVNLDGMTGGSGSIMFNRVLPCTGCNLTVKDGFGSILNSTSITVVSGMSGNSESLMILDVDSPISSNVGMNNSVPRVGSSVILYAYWMDNIELDTAMLETNESGVWANKTLYGSPISLSGDFGWSNFTWVNSTVTVGTVVGWRVWTTDTRGNLNVTPNQYFVVTDTINLTVYVNDTLSNPVEADSNGDGVIVALYNASFYQSKNTTTLGYVMFSDLADGGTYNISVNGTMQGYGLNISSDFVLIGSNKTTLLTNVTNLIVNITNATFYPVSDANVTVYLSDNTTVLKNATGGDIVGSTNAGGIVMFTRVIPCNDCNATVSKDDGGVILNSSRVNIIAGNSSNYVWIDPPLSTGYLLDLNFTINSDIVPRNVNISMRIFGTDTVIASNLTDIGGSAQIYGVPSGIYDFIVDGEAVGYSKSIYSRNYLGVLIQNNGTANVDGRIKMSVNGIMDYYVAVRANGYIEYDDLNEGIVRRGTYDDSVNSSGVEPMISLELSGNTTLSGYVYDKNFKQPMNLSYEPVPGAVMGLYTTALCDVMPSSGLLRYRVVMADNGTYSMTISPMMYDDPSVEQDYCAYVDVVGFKDGFVNDVDVDDNLNVGLAGDGVITGYVKSQDNSAFVDGATVLLRSYQCYDGDSGPNEQCEAYSKNTDSNGYFSFNVNSKDGIPSYMPYTVRVTKYGYHIYDGYLISSLDSYDNFIYLVPASISVLKINVTSEYDEWISRNVSISLVGTTEVGSVFSINESYCEFQNNEYACTISRDDVSDYNLTVNGTMLGYDYYIESNIIPSNVVIQRNIVLNVTKVNITLFDEGGMTVSGVNVTIGSLPPVMNQTVSGSAVFYKVQPGSYSVNIVGLPEYLGVSNSSIDVVNLGGMNSKVLYANETQFYVNITNGTAGVFNVGVTIGSLFNMTDGSGVILFRRINNSQVGSYVVEFNETDLYLNGYFPPNVSVDIQPGLDKETGNNLTVVLNSTSDYGIFVVGVAIDEVNVSLWYNQTTYISHQLSDWSGVSYLKTNVSVYNESLYLKVNKLGYNPVTLGPYNSSGGNVTFVDVSMTPNAICVRGLITSLCSCGGSLYSVGYCCDGLYQMVSCDSGGSVGGGGSSWTSSGGGVVLIPSNASGDDGDDEDRYDLFLDSGNLSVLRIYEGETSCVSVPIIIVNTGDGVLDDVMMEVSNIPVGIEARYESFIGDIYPGNDLSVEVALCSFDDSIVDSDYLLNVSVYSAHVMKDIMVMFRVIHDDDSVADDIRAKMDNLASMLFEVDVSILTPELKEYYDLAVKVLKDAENSLEAKDYDSANRLLVEAEGYVLIVIDGVSEMKPDTPNFISGLIFLMVVFVFAVGSVLFYKYLMRRRIRSSMDMSVPKAVSAPAFSVPKVRFPVLKIPTVLLKVLGMHDVYYTHSRSKKNYIADVVENVVKVKCPSCSGKVFNNRCVWCGFDLTSNVKKTDGGIVKSNKKYSYSQSHIGNRDVYYTQKSCVDGKGERFVTRAVENVVEGACSKCGGRLYKGKCVWCA